jgi:hypothetical protein
MKKIQILILWVFLFPIILDAQETTLNETLDFIKKKVDQYGMDQGRTKTNLDYTGTKVIFNKEPAIGNAWIESFFLEDMKVSKGDYAKKGWDLELIFTCKTGKCVKFKYKSNGVWEEASYSKVSLYFTNREICDRVFMAFSYAISIAEKKEPF